MNSHMQTRGSWSPWDEVEFLLRVLDGETKRALAAEELIDRMARCLAHQAGQNCFCDECEATYALPLVVEAHDAWENEHSDGTIADG